MRDQSLPLLLLLLISLTLGCIGESPREEEGKTLVILTRHDTTIQELAKEEFLKSEISKKFGITKMKFVSVPASLWPEYARKGRVDLAWGGGPTLFDNLMDLELLAPLESKDLLDLIERDIPSEVSGIPLVRKIDGKVYWVAAAISSFGFTVNREVIEKWGLPIPRKWEDLASEIYAREIPLIGIADPTRSTSNTRIYEIILQAMGWEKGWKTLSLIAANSRIFDSSDAVREAVISGEIAIGTTIDFFGYTAMKLNPNCVYVIPEGESVINGDPIALLSTSENKEEAQAFVLWILTEGQRIWLDERVNRMPVNPRVFDSPEGRSREDLRKSYERTMISRGIEFDDSRALSIEEVLQNYFKSSLIDSNEELRRAWIELNKAKKEGRISEEKFNSLLDQMLELKFRDPITGKEVYLTEEYARELNQRIKEDRELLELLKREWRESSRRRYLKVLEELGLG